MNLARQAFMKVPMFQAPDAARGGLSGAYDVGASTQDTAKYYPDDLTKPKLEISAPEAAARHDGAMA
ncbi:MAG: hypothetical protein ACPGRX_00855 [Bdellovibrionales bacterium]